ncbi:U3-containing 90S pre-ribosomal complex subunit-domain containing protein [Cokeromyces recurvatus]|uniref:U3-containing 90S pre-ribosomal complex subunit-domain containing protein n=1 Tax=Cokeromyces recurvatus TaxID=90255 RepID=UPI00221F41C4|nr:U3-containing 90S pre-ribosomal complex subunit-domain containing protein [Cokeromyces recurvatus]KAI7902010.1 U3-containing 90S pre-ribosomal complex subunit-domain containing protein [Cokeromyces recurvatus]
MSEIQNKKIPTSADDFEDDYQEDNTLVYSDNENKFSDNDVDTDEINVSLKRKQEMTSEEPPKKKKKKHPKKKREENPFDKINISQEDIQVQANYLADRQKIALPQLSTVELEEQVLPVSNLVDNEKFKEEHVLESLPKYVKFGVAGHKKLSKKPTQLASPVVLIITHSAIRAVNLVRALKEFSSTAKIAKLFAKHFKIEDQIKFLEQEAIHIGVGTPNRLLTLVEQGHLKLDNLELVVIDTERNPKSFNIFDIQEVRGDLFNFLGQFISPLMKDKTKIGLF